MVRQRSAKPLRPGSNPGGASKTKSTSEEVLFVLEMKRSLREQEDAYANEAAFAYEVLLRNDKERFASYSRSECFIEAEPLLHTSESECFIPSCHSSAFML